MPPAPSAHKPRRTHHKTRTGCAVCRRRKIKCDEAKPNCQNCQRRGLACEYFPTNTGRFRNAGNSNNRDGETVKVESQAPSGLVTVGGDYRSTVVVLQADGTRQATQDGRQWSSSGSIHRNNSLVAPSGSRDVGFVALNIEDLEMMYWYTTRTYRTFTPRRDIQICWRDLVVRRAFKPCNHFLLHGILALAGLHRATVEYDKEKSGNGGSGVDRSLAMELHIASARHWELTLSGYRDTINTNRNKDTSEGLFATSSLMAIYALGEGYFDPDSHEAFDYPVSMKYMGPAPPPAVPIIPQTSIALNKHAAPQMPATYFLPDWWNLLRGFRALFLMQDLWNWIINGDFKVLVPQRNLYFNSQPNPHQADLMRLDELLEGCEDEFVDSFVHNLPGMQTNMRLYGVTDSSNYLYNKAEQQQQQQHQATGYPSPTASQPDGCPGQEYDSTLAQLVQARIALYQDSLDRIRTFFSQFYNEEEVPVASAISFPPSCSDDFMKLIQERKPRALIILAYYVVLFYLLEQIPEPDLEEDLAPEFTLGFGFGSGIPGAGVSKNRCGKIWWARGVARREIRKIERYLGSVREEEGRRSGDPDKWLRWLEWPKRMVSGGA